MQETRTTIAFVDDHPVLLKGVMELFSLRPQYEVVGSGGSAKDAIDLMVSKAPEVLFLDLSMPGDVFETIAYIAQQYSGTRIVVFTAFSSVDSALRALDAGATGFVLKGSGCDELLEAVSAVMRGELFVSHQYAAQVLSGMRARSRSEEIRRALKLSLREKQIVAQLMNARTNKEIADTLSLSEKTVKHYMTGLMAKLHARNRVEVVIEAQRSGALN